MDYYHFAISLTPGEVSTRIAAEKRAQERQRKWAAWADKGQLPSPAVLKRAVRKVRRAAAATAHAMPGNRAQERRWNAALFCLQGIPPMYRPMVWMDISGASKKKRQFGDSYYASMVIAGQQSPVLKQIQLVGARRCCCRR